jgi:ferrous iron transport protein A
LITEAGRVLHLAELVPGDRARVLGYADPDATFARHLTSLGLIPGTALRVVRRAPLGDPIEIEFRGAHVVLRPGEAAVLELEAI